MSRYIDADKLYQKMLDLQGTKRERYLDIDDVRKIIKEQPTVYVKTAEWIDREIYDADRWKCSKCGRTEQYRENFCPNCGRKMKGVEE